MIKAKGVGEEVRGRLSGHGFSTERREERRRMRSEVPRWGNERADESHTRAFTALKTRTGARPITADHILCLLAITPLFVTEPYIA
jgi:hypothetical protein